MFKPIMEQQKEYFWTGATLDIRNRKKQLEALDRMLADSIPEILEAVRLDLGRSPAEAYMSEIVPVINELRCASRRLKNWSGAKRTPGTILSPFSRFEVVPEPKGQVLIISPFNYPVQLALIPLISALAAGNTVLLKLSEQSAHTGRLLTELLNRTFDARIVFATSAPPDEFEDLFDLPYDHIFFTGSTRIGREIMKTAGSRLTTATLELGGKSPAIVHRTADLKKAAKRIAWGKCLNSGQTCIAPDYLLVERSVKDDLVAELKKAFRELYPDPLVNEDYSAIISKRQLSRLTGYLEGQKILHGGSFDESLLKLEPTLVDEPGPESDLLKDEIFGPILPVLSFVEEGEIAERVALNPDPLALYVFAEDKKFISRIKARIPFGSGAVNDVLVQILSTSVPFGGRGASGMGSYHGKHGFDAFSHYKTIVRSPSWFDLPLRYPPYSKKLLSLLRKLYR